MNSGKRAILFSTFYIIYGFAKAVAATSVMSDRICITSKGTKNISVSAADLLQCCSAIQCRFGCRGGDPYAAWKYWHDHGLPAGGDFGSQEGCRPYTVAPCLGCTDLDILLHTKACSKFCDNSQDLKYNSSDFTRGASAYQLRPDEKTIQIEIMENGPVQATFDVYSDFIHYKSGIYTKTSKAKLSGILSVKIIGWGQQDDIPYWIAANSWGTSWGEGGYFKIARGINECNIEDYVLAGELLTE